MKTHNTIEQNLFGRNSARTLLFALSSVICLFAAIGVKAASQTWTNAPVDNSWINTTNWVGRAIPGALNSSGNADIATFNAPIPLSGIGGAANPIINDATRGVRGLNFDTADCGAYVFGSSVADNQLEIMNTGFTVVNTAVTNPVIFNIGLRTKLPSSTNGRYDFTNNAANSNASLYLEAINNTSANTRPMELHLAGSNTGTNTIARIDDIAGGAGAIRIIKEGTGTWILSGANDLPQKTSAGVVATVQVNNGTLEVKDPGSLGLITVANLVVQTTGTLQIDGITLNNGGITLRNGGTIRMNGSGTVTGVTMGNAAATSATLATTSSSDVMTVGVVSAGAADTVAHIAGPGTVLFSVPSTYIGRWSLDAGTSQLSDPTALGTGANFNINAGTVIDVSPLGAVTYTLSTKALSANGAGTTVGSTAATIKAAVGGTVDLLSKPMTLTFTPTSFTGDTTHPALLISQGTLAVNGNSITVSNASGIPLGAGTYQLVHQASGNITSSGGFVTLVTGTGLGAGLIGEIVASGGDLNLLVTAYTPKNLVWTGGNPDNNWDRLITANWLSGGAASTFNLYDSVTFNPIGSTNPTVNLAQILSPTSVTVDTSANTYTFSGVGQIAGGANLTKLNSGTLVIQTTNTYSGGTIISNGTVRVGADDAIPSTGVGDVALYSPGILDLNNFSDTINGLNGNGTVDITGGGTSTLTIGDNGNSGTFSGVIQNTSGTLGLTKSGNGTETLTASNTYVGPTIIDTGTLRVTNINALGSGASAVTINNGTLDLATSLIVASLAGNGGAIANNSTAATVTNRLFVQGTSTSGSLISGRVAITVNGGTLRLNAANTYSGGTIVASGAGLGYGNVGQSGSGGVIASNATTIALASGNNPSSAVAANITTVDSATVTFTSGTTANSWNGQFIGSATATNIFSGGNMSMGGNLSFSNFLGTVIITNGGVRWFTALSGGDNTTFVFTNGGGGFTRDATTVRLGALFGNGSITAPSVTPPGTFWIGGKNLDSTFSGTINGANNIGKVGTGKLTFDGAASTDIPYSNGDGTFTTNIVDNGDGTFTTNLVDNLDGTFSTNHLYASRINYTGNTTISNGVLALVVPNTLAASPIITLATPTAVLDATRLGYVSNLLSIVDGTTPTNSFLVTNGVFTLDFGQTLAGFGILKGSNVVSSGTINPGNASAGGTLSISNHLSINDATTENFDLSDDLTGAITPSDLIKVNGDVTLSGGSAINVSALNGVLKVGTYPLIKYSGSLRNEGGVVPSGPIVNFVLGGTFSQTTRATLALNNAPGEVDFTVVNLNSHDLIWTGDGVANVWDVITSPNWNDGGSASTFYQLDAVTFDDSSANRNVNLAGTLVPSAITVNNASTTVSNANGLAGTYTFGSNGVIGGVLTLIKKGSGTLLLINGANTYTGGTILSNGVLKAGSDSGNNQNDRALGTGPVTVHSTAELRFGGNSGAIVNHFITNAITVNGGTVRAQDGVQRLTNSIVTITSSGATFQTAFSTKNLVFDSPVVGPGNLTISVPATFAGGAVLFTHASNTLSGSILIASNGNLTLTGSAGISNSPLIDIQLAGALDSSGRTNRLLPLLSGQTLIGNGTVRGNLTTASGSTLSPGAAAATLGTLTVANTTGFTNTATLNGTTIMELNRAASPNSDRLVAAGTNVFGGTLTVINIGAALVAGDTFQLFTSVANRGAFAVTNLPSLTSGLLWNNSLASNGRLTVVAAVNTTPTNITAVVTGNTLNLTWPLDHTGWSLQAQTNTINVGLNTNWVTVPGSAATNSVSFTINPANSAVFYRLVYP